MTEPQIHIVLNPSAGGGVDDGPLRRWLKDHPTARLHRTGGPGDGAELARSAARSGAGVVVAAGGDGTVREVVQGLVGLDPGRRPRLGIIPCGTANDLSRAVGLGADAEGALEVLGGGSLRPVDLIHCELDGTVHHCVNVVTAGFGGRLHEALDEETKEFWGPLAYLRAGVETWSDTEPWEVVLDIDSATEELSLLNLVIGNGSRAGWGLPVAPRADPFDGLLEVVAVRDAPGMELSRLGAAFLGGDPDPEEHDALIYRQARRIELRAGTRIPLSLDGEQHSARHSGYEVLEGALELLVPDRRRTP